MVKADLIEKMAKSAHLSHKEAKAALNAFLEATTKALKKGEKVKLEMFGTFSVINRKEKTGKHPRTGEPIIISARKAIKFNPSSTLYPTKIRRKLQENDKTGI